MERSKLKLNVVGIASSKNAIFNRDGIDLENYSEELKKSDPSTPEVLRDTILAMNIFNSVFVDRTASKDVAALYQSLLEHNVSIIAANKIAASSEYENYEKLKKTAIQRGVVFRFETNVGAGLPIIGPSTISATPEIKSLRLRQFSQVRSTLSLTPSPASSHSLRP